MTDFEPSGIDKLKLKGAGLVAAAAIGTVGVGAAYQAGMLDDRSEAPAEVTGPLEVERSKYYGKPVVDGIAFDKDGNFIEIDTLEVNPLNREVYEQAYRISPKTDVEGGMKAYEDAQIGTGQIPEGVLKQYHIMDNEGKMTAKMVYGETFEDNAGGKFGNHQAGNDKTGLFWKLDGVNDEGQKFTAFIPAQMAVVEAGVIEVDLTGK